MKGYPYSHFVGVDVSKATLDFALSDDAQPQSIKNATEPIVRQFIERIKSQPTTIVVLEAPMNGDSGQQAKKRKTFGGRSYVRCVLYMATLAATRFNPKIKAFYQHLLAQGKPKKLALIAAMRKLLTIVNTLVKNDVVWIQKRPDPPQRTQDGERTAQRKTSPSAQNRNPKRNTEKG